MNNEWKKVLQEDLSSESRRRFLRFTVLGGGASLLASVWPQQTASAAEEVEALLLTCMDYRLVDKTGRYMDRAWSSKQIRPHHSGGRITRCADREVSGVEPDLLGALERGD